VYMYGCWNDNLKLHGPIATKFHIQGVEKKRSDILPAYGIHQTNLKSLN
jgi:hypothetical protein